MNTFADYNKLGFQVLPQVFSSEETSALRQVAEGILAMANSSADAGPLLHNILSGQPGNSAAVGGRLSLHVEHVFRFSDTFRRVIHDSRLTMPARAVCAPELRLLDDQLYWKPAFTGGSTYVHPDSDFFGPLGVVTVWLPLCDVGESNGCLWVVPGSHRLRNDELRGLRRRTAPPPGVAPDLRPFDYFYDVDWGKAGFHSVPLAVGDVLLLHNHVLHCSLDVKGDRERLAYIVEYVAAGDAERYREHCAGLFEYHDRFRYMDMIAPHIGGLEE